MLHKDFLAVSYKLGEVVCCTDSVGETVISLKVLVEDEKTGVDIISVTSVGETAQRKECLGH